MEYIVSVPVAAIWKKIYILAWKRPRERWRIDIPVVLGVRSLHVGVSYNAVQGLALERLARGQFLILADVIR